MNNMYICENLRTPFASIGGFLSRINPKLVGSLMIHRLLEKNSALDPDMIDELLIGNILGANLGSDFASQVIRTSKLNDDIERGMINCGHITGLKLVDYAVKSLTDGPSVIAAMAIENISSAPNYIPNARVKEAIEGEVPTLNGVLRDAYFVDEIKNFAGQLAETVIKKGKLTRKEIDNYVLESIAKTKAAAEAGKFANEICKVKIDIKDGADFIFTEDTEYKRYDETPDITTLDPSFQKDGVLTLASSARSADGGSVALIANEEAVKKYGLSPVAKISGYSEVYGKAEDYVKSGAKATKNALKQGGIKLANVDFIELHEDFASTPLLYSKSMKISRDKLNKNGGTLGVGNPISSTGLRLVNSICNQFNQNEGTKAVATLCGPSGGSAALLLEKV